MNENTGAKIGCCTVSEAGGVNDYLNTSGLNQKCRFAWNRFTEGSDACLYALKLNAGKESLLSGADIESVTASQEGSSENYSIGFRFKESAVNLWAEATKSNINSEIAILIDNQVIYSPVVKSEVRSGICTITGIMSQQEARYFSALGNNGQLPVGFKVLE